MLALLAQANWEPAVRSVLDDECSHVALHVKLSGLARGPFMLSHNLLVMRVSRALKSGYFNPKARHLKAVGEGKLLGGLGKCAFILRWWCVRVGVCFWTVCAH